MTSSKILPGELPGDLPQTLSLRDVLAELGIFLSRAAPVNAKARPFLEKNAKRWFVERTHSWPTPSDVLYNTYQTIPADGPLREEWLEVSVALSAATLNRGRSGRDRWG